MIYDSFKDIKGDEFYCLTGVEHEIFLKMIEILNLAEKNKKIRGGRKNKLSMEDRLLMTLEYWRLYNPFVFLANKYGINKSNCVRNVLWIENVLAKHEEFHIPGKKELIKSNPETQMLVIDATENSVERFKKNRKTLILARKNNAQLSRK